MVSGNAWIQHLWNGDIVNIRYQVDNPEDFKFQQCKEGIPVGSDNFVIPVNAKHPGTALLFIEYMLEPENAAQNVEWIGYPMPYNGAATEAFQGLVKDDPEINVTTEDLENGQTFVNLKGEGRLAWDKVWTDVPSLREASRPMSENRFASGLPAARRRCGCCCCSWCRWASCWRFPSATPTTSGEAIYGRNLENYSRVFDADLIPVLVRSVGFALATVVLCLLIGYPVAYYIAIFGGRWKNVLLALVVLPFFVNYLVRTYAWIAMLGDDGSSTGCSTPTCASSTPRTRSIGGLVYGFLAFMILPDLRRARPYGSSADRGGQGPLRRALADLSPRDAAPHDPGRARRGRALVFLPAVGDFVAASLLGGPEQVMVGNLIQQQFQASDNWPFGAALTVVMMVFLLVWMVLYLRSAAREAKEARGVSSSRTDRILSRAPRHATGDGAQGSRHRLARGPRSASTGPASSSCSPASSSWFCSRRSRWWCCSRSTPVDRFRTSRGSACAGTRPSSSRRR